MVTGKLNNAKKENDFIYHEPVPVVDKLPEVKPHCLVKGVGFDTTDEAIAGR